MVIHSIYQFISLCFYLSIRHVGHCWKSKNKLISDVLLWTPTHGRASVGQPARTYLHQLCVDTRCNLENLPVIIDDRDGEREKSVLSVQLDDDDDDDDDICIHHSVYFYSNHILFPSIYQKIELKSSFIFLYLICFLFLNMNKEDQFHRGTPAFNSNM